MGIPVASGTLTTWIKVFLGPPLLVRKARIQCQVSLREEDRGAEGGSSGLLAQPHSLLSGTTGNSSVHIGKTGPYMSLLARDWQDSATADCIVLHALYSWIQIIGGSLEGQDS